MIFWVSCCQNVNSPLSVLVPLVYNWWAKSSVQPLCLGTASVPLTRAGWEGPSIVKQSGRILYTGTRHTCSRDTGICQASVLSISTFNWTSQREVVDHGQVDSGQNGVKLEVSTVEKIVRVPQSGGHLSELAIVGFTNLKLKYFCKLWQAEELAALNCNYISIKSC